VQEIVSETMFVQFDAGAVVTGATVF